MQQSKFKIGDKVKINPIDPNFIRDKAINVGIGTIYYIEDYQYYVDIGNKKIILYEFEMELCNTDKEKICKLKEKTK